MLLKDERYARYQIDISPGTIAAMETKKFQKRVEDFVCEHCGHAVKGTGYTNHCSECLWSKHVDVMPGDRANACGGMMEPIYTEGSTPDYVIVHKCKTCGTVRRNGIAVGDSLVAIVELAERAAAKDLREE